MAGTYPFRTSRAPCEASRRCELVPLEASQTPRPAGRRPRAWIAGAVAVAAFVAGTGGPARAATFTVNSIADSVDASPGDGLALTASGTTTLRAAVMEANALAGADVVILPAGTFLLSRPGAGEDAGATGDLDVTGSLTITGAGISATVIDAGGAVTADRAFHVIAGPLVLSQVTVQGGRPAAEGGGFFVVTGQTLSLDHVRVTGHTAVGAHDGGGIYDEGGTVDLTDVEIAWNHSDGSGGGIESHGTVTWLRGAAHHNSAGINGGAFESRGVGSSATLTNVTVSANSSDNFVGGLLTQRTTTLTNCTIVGNSSPSVGGIGRSGVGTFRMKNTIIAGNTGGNCPEAFVSLGNNIESPTNTCGCTGVGDQNSVSAPALNLGALADNGGPNPTHALLTGSVAVNTATNIGAPSTDQRGVARPQGGGFDVGAFEVQAGGITVSPTSGLTTSEAGGTAAFTIVLTTPPTADVTIGLSSSDTTEGTVSPASVTFSAGDWSAPRTITVTGVDDSYIDGNVAYTITTLPAASADAGYAGVNAPDVSVTNTDLDNCNLVVVDTTADVVDGVTGSIAQLMANRGPDGRISLREAVIAANNTPDGPCGQDEIVLPAGLYALAIAGANESQAQTGDLDVTAGRLSISGSGTTATVVDGGALDRVFEVLGGATLTIADLTVRNGSGVTLGGGVYVQSSNALVLDRVALTGNSGDQGGGLYVSTSATATLTDVDLSGNSAPTSGGGISNSGTVTFGRGTVRGNTSTRGGGIESASSSSVLNLTNVTVSGNIATSGLQDGGGLRLRNQATVVNCTIYGNLGGAGISKTGGAAPTTEFRNTIVAANVDGNATFALTSAGGNLEDANTCGFNQPTDQVNTTPNLGPLQNNGGPTWTHALLAGSAAIDAGIAAGAPAVDQRGVARPQGAGYDVGAFEWTGPSLDISGRVFEDVNYGGGAGRDWATASAAGASARPAARVELYDAAGAFLAATTTGAAGTYVFSGLVSGTYTVRVVNSSVTGSRSGYVPGLLSVQTYRTDASSGTPLPVTDHVGGEVPNQADAGNGSTTLAALTSGTTTAQSIAAVTLGSAAIGNVDFGFSFDAIVNVNDAGQGSLRQFLANASALGNAGLAQAGRTAGIEHALWMIPNGTSAPGLRALYDDFSAGVAVLAPLSPLPAVTDPVVLDATTQPGFGGTPVIELNGTNGGGSGLDLAAGGCTVRGLIINRFPGDGIHVSAGGGNTIAGNHIGTDAAAAAALPNGGAGVAIAGSANNVVGGVAAADRNVVSDNLGSGVSLTGSGAVNNAILGNAIRNNAGLGIDLGGDGPTPNDGAKTPAQPNQWMDAPVFTSAAVSGGVLSVAGYVGSAPGQSAFAGARVELFEAAVDPSGYGEAAAYLGFLTADAAGAFSGSLAAGSLVPGSVVTGTATDASGNTSEFSANRILVAPAITVAPLAGLTTTEAGGTAAFTVVLNAQPTADVTIGLTSSDLSEGTVAPASLTFTSADWNVAQSVTVTGVDDAVQDGDVAYTILTAAASSADPGYGGLDPADVSVTNIDDETAGVTVNPTAGLTTTEAGGTAAFTVVLNAQPTADVTIGLTSSDLSEGTVAPASLTFTSADWNVAQSVTVTGVDDAVQDGDVAYTILTAAASSADPNYGGLDPADVSVTNTDDDVAGITVAPLAGLTTTEAGGTAAFTVVLNAQPSADVTIGLTSSDLSEGAVAPASLTFTSADWNVAQSVTVTGVDDAVQDGDVAYTILTAAASSADPNYGGLDPADVSVTNTDDDVAVTATFTAAPGVVPADGSTTGVLTVTLTDGFGAPLPGRTIVFSSDRGAADQIQQPGSPTDANGTATGTVRSTVTGTATFTAVDVTDGITLGPRPGITFVQNVVLMLDLVAGRLRATVGQAIPYTLAVRNPASTALAGFRVVLEAPAGFHLVPGSAAWRGASLADSAIGAASAFVLDSLGAFVDANGDGVAGPGESGYGELTCVLVPGAAVEPGLYESRATAFDGCQTCAISNVARADVRIEDSGWLSEGTILGQIFEDRNRDGRPDADEPGIAAAQVVLDDGTRITADAQGRFHVPAVAPGERVLKLDGASLTRPGVPTTDEALVVSVRPGLLARAAFGVRFDQDTIRIGRPAVRGLAVTVDTTHDAIELVGNVQRPALLANGRDVPLRACDARISADGLDEIVRLEGGRLASPIRFTVDVRGRGPVAGYALCILGEAGDTLRTLQGRGAPPSRLTWDGRFDDGHMIRGGSVHPYQLVVTFEDGMTASSPRRTLGVERHTSISLTMTGDAFESNQVTLSAKARDALSRLARVMRQSPDEKVIIEGHTDSIGTAEDNLQLSRRRAEAAVAYLVERERIPRERLVVDACGETRPVASNAFPEGRELNRRIEIRGQASEVTRARLLDYFRSPPSVTVAGTDVGVDDDGRFAVRIPRPADGRLDMRLVDRQGRTVSARVVLPRLELHAPLGEVRVPFSGSEGDFRAEPRAATDAPEGEPLAALAPVSTEHVVGHYRLRGHTDAGNTVEINGDPVEVAGDGAFTGEVPLRAGGNTLGVLARDPEGHVQFTNLHVEVADREPGGREVVVDPGEPPMTVELPPQGAALGSPRLQVSGRTDPAYRVSVNGDSVNVAEDGRFSTMVTLPEGRSTLVVGVRDPWGGEGFVRREVEVRSNRMFIVALADGIVGAQGASSFLRTSGAGSGATWNEGRLAYSMSGRVGAGYRLTSSFDTGRREFRSLLGGGDRREDDRLLRHLDPDRLYPVYGDSSTIAYENASEGRFHLALDGEALRARVGNLPISLQETELAGFQRTLYGAQVRYEGGARDADGGRATSITVLGAEALHTHVRNEIGATGGSLYYLSQAEVVEGSEQVTLVVRDRTTGLPLMRIPQVRGRDYEVKYEEGRLFFSRPVQSVWDDRSLINGTPLSGHPVTIEAEFETREDRWRNGAAGGRLHQRVGSRLGLGATYLEDRTGEMAYTLGGTDAEFRLGERSRIVGELARSEGTGGRTFASRDGGVGFFAADTSASDQGRAWKAATELDLGDLLGVPGDVRLGGYVKQVEPGFRATGSAGPAGRDQFGWSGSGALGGWGRWTTRFDRESRTDSAAGLPGMLRRSDRFALGWQRDTGRWGAAAEYQGTSLGFSDSTLRQGTGALRLWHRPRPWLTTTLERLQALSGPDGDLTSLGVRMRLPYGLEVEGRGATGADGRALLGGASMRFGERRIYARDEWTARPDAPQRSTVLGMEAPLGPMSRAYTEYQWRHAGGEESLRSLLGLEQGWRHASGVTLRLSGEWSSSGQGGGAIEHRTVASELAYAGRSPVTGSTRAEWRRDGIGGNERQLLSATRIETRLTGGFSVRGDYRYSTTDGAVPGPRLRYEETGVGLAYRTPDTDRLYALARYTWLDDRRPAGPADSLARGALLGVAALEATYGLRPGVEWSGKFALGVRRDDVANLALPTTRMHLWIQRVHLALMDPFGFASEYRMLRQDRAGGTKRGWLQELTWDLSKQVRMGGGYNFTSIADDTFAQDGRSDHGWFIRAQARY